MNKILLCALFIYVVFPFNLKAEWVSLNGKSSLASPKVTLVSDNGNSTVIKVEISGFNVKEIVSDGQTFQSVDLMTEIFTTNPGFPELPYIAKVLAIPDQAGISIDVLETGIVHSFKNINLPPARSSWYEGDPELPYIQDIDAYQSGTVFPADYARIETPSVFRDFRITRVSVFPVRYIPSQKELQVVSTVTVRINYGPGEVINPKTSPKRAIAPSFADIYRTFIFNYGSVLDNLYDGKEEGTDVILCIMPDEFTATFEAYADWKKQSGIDVHVTKFSDIGANASNPDIIKNHITDAYYNWANPPTYVLFVGDDGVFPKKIVTYPDYSFPNEDYFVEIEGNDYFPEMMPGRFTNQGDYRLQVMVNKLIKYEKTPYTVNTNWFKKATVCSNNNYVSQIETKRFAAGQLRDMGGFTVDTMMSDGYWGYDCTYDLQDVINAINNGRSFLNYRGEGWSDGWHASCYQFSVDDVSNLSNGEKFTFVTSIGCGVGMFNSGNGNCFGEEWMEMGTLDNPKGACCFLGPTSNTHTTYNNKIDKGIYWGMFSEGLKTPGQALLRGKFYMYNVYGNDYYTQYHFKIYCCLGDPSIHIWKEVPSAVQATYPGNITVGPNELEFNISFVSSGLPAANAKVCITGEDVFTTAIADTTGKAIINLSPSISESLIVTITGGNIVPFQGTIMVEQPAELVEPHGDPVIVDIDGNLDGLIDPNENGTMAITLKNWGSQTAFNVQATLSTTAVNYLEVVTTGPVSYGNISSGNVYTANPFQFYVKPDCPVGQVIPVQLSVSSSINTWDYNFDLEIRGCNLVITNFVIEDQGEPNMNYRLDPGETVKLVFSVENIGDDLAPDVIAVLSSNDPHITINDPNGSFGNISIQGTALNMENYFVVSADLSCPTNYSAMCTVHFYTQNGNYPYQKISDFAVPVSLPIPNDYTGPDAYGYYAYASTDAFYDQIPSYEWYEIETVGTKLNVPLVTDYTETVSLPFPFKYYGNQYTQIRISTDGWFAFGAGNQTAPVNTPLPNFDNIDNMAAIFWDDLYDTATIEGNILYYNDLANHRFIIEWDSIAHNNLGSEPKSEVFQAILFDPVYYPTPTGDGEIIFQYKKVEEPESITLGIENHSQTIGLQYVYNEYYNPTASAITTDLAIKFTTVPPYINIVTDVEEVDGTVPQGFSLGQNQPNPFRYNTLIKYSLPEPCSVKLNIYDFRGGLVSTLQDGRQPAGNHSVEWNGKDDSGNSLSPGLYFYRLQTDKFSGTMKMFMLK